MSRSQDGKLLIIHSECGGKIKKIKGLGIRQAGIQKNERRRMIHSGSTGNRMTPRKQNDVIHQVGTEGFLPVICHSDIKKPFNSFLW